MGKCQWKPDCQNQARRERLGTFKGQFNREMTLIGTICEAHRPMLPTALFSYWVCGRLAFLEEAEETDAQ